MDEFASYAPERPRPRFPVWAIVAIALAIPAVILAAWFVRSRSAARIDAVNLARMESQLADTLGACDGAADPDACRLGYVREAALGSGALTLCDVLTGGPYDECTWAVANATSDPSACASMNDAALATLCADVLNARLAAEAGDATLCARVTDETSRANCVTSVTGPERSATCAGDASYCADLARVEAAVEAGDASMCDAVADSSLRGRCVDQTGLADAPDLDGDGLTAAEESRYGTSDRNVDSDGDGFPDGDEVRSGYDPAGPGPLVP